MLITKELLDNEIAASTGGVENAKQQLHFVQGVLHALTQLRALADRPEEPDEELKTNAPE